VTREEDRARGQREVVFCVVPRELAPKLHDELREFYAGDPTVRVVVEMRKRERRSRPRRRAEAPVSDRERRRIKSAEGRRVADRRAHAVAIEPPALPRKLRPYADQIRFVERAEPTEQKATDVDSARLVVRYQAGDKSAMSDLYLRYFDAVYGYTRLALRDSHEAEDVTQQVFMQVFQSLPTYELRGSTPFRAWLFRIARNAVVDSLRKSDRVSVEEPATVALRMDTRRNNEVEAALEWLSDGDISFFVERLPAAQRGVLVLRFMLDLSTDEVAAVIGKSPKAVRQLQSRALRTLRERLAAITVSRKRIRAPMLVRMRPAPVLASRRFALGRFANSRR
jgi:RNA polymerase sigma-70 factor (ECF subfamily)